MPWKECHVVDGHWSGSSGNLSQSFSSQVGRVVRHHTAIKTAPPTTCCKALAPPRAGGLLHRAPIFVHPADELFD
jgi:hypothetical protein